MYYASTCLSVNGPQSLVFSFLDNYSESNSEFKTTKTLLQH